MIKMLVLVMVTCYQISGKDDCHSSIQKVDSPKSAAIEVLQWKQIASASKVTANLYEIDFASQTMSRVNMPKVAFK